MIRGLRIEGGPDLANDAFALLTNVGTFWIEDCSALAAGNPQGFGPPPALHISRGAAFLVGCEFFGSPGSDAVPGPDGELATAGSEGLACQSVRVVMFDTLAVGGRGGDGPGDSVFTANGGAGASLFGAASSWVMGGSFVGGDEGSNDPKGAKAGPGIAAASQGRCTCATCTCRPER